MDRCPKCGYEFKKEYCKCKNLTIFDLLYAFGNGEFKDYCKRCNKEVMKIKAELILAKGI